MIYFMYTYTSSDRRKKKIRKKILKHGKLRLTVYKTNKHIYAQLFSSDGSHVLASASSLDKKFKDLSNGKTMSKTDDAILVANLLTDSLIAKNITCVAFDRSGFKFHGRIKIIAEVIRKNGINC